MSGKIFIAAGATAAAGITLGLGLGGAYASASDKAPKPQKGTIWAVVNWTARWPARARTSRASSTLGRANSRVRQGRRPELHMWLPPAPRGLTFHPVPTPTSRKWLLRPPKCLRETYDSDGSATSYMVDSDFHLAILC